MDATPLPMLGLVLVKSRVFPDSRGSFMETWSERNLQGAGIDARFVQDNLSVSHLYALRGLHYQVSPRAQGKLVRVLRGEIFDVVVDLRRLSRTYKHPLAIALSATTGDALWIPAGFAHGFLALTDDALVQYKVTDYWSPEHERTIRWNDPALAIEWPLPAGARPLLSEKDSTGQPLADAEPFP